MKPRLHKWADLLTESLIYFMIIFSPWAFGTTEPWSIWTMNISAYALGLLLITKCMVRRTASYTLWSQAVPTNELSPRQNRLRLIHKYCNLLTAVFMLLLLTYMATSAINARASYNLETKEYSYFLNFTKILPHSFDARASWLLFWQYLGFCILFWATKDWLEGAKQSQDSSSINPRLKRLLFLICLNGAALALECILQRIYYSPIKETYLGEFKGKLLFLLEPSINSANITHFGPFAYRSNAASYFNLIWPIGIGLYILTVKNKLKLVNHRIGAGSELLLPFCIILIASGPIISAARGGALITAGLVIIISFTATLFQIKSKSVLMSFLALIIITMWLSFYFGWDHLSTRFTFLDSNLNSRKQIFAAAFRMIDQYVLSNAPPSPYGSGPGSFQTIIQFEIDERMTTWASWAHNDYLELLLTFGIPGTVIILIILTLQLLKLFLNWLNSNKSFYYLACISILGILVHAIGDFPFQVYSIVSLTIILLASITENKTTRNLT